LLLLLLLLLLSLLLLELLLELLLLELLSELLLELLSVLLSFRLLLLSLLRVLSSVLSASRRPCARAAVDGDTAVTQSNSRQGATNTPASLLFLFVLIACLRLRPDFRERIVTEIYTRHDLSSRIRTSGNSESELTAETQRHSREHSFCF